MFYPGTPSHDDFVGTAGDDTFDLSTGGSDTAAGKGGDDTFSMVGALNAGDRLDGGIGADTVELYGNYNLVFQAATITNIEALSPDGNFTFSLTMNDANVGAGRQFFVELQSNDAVLNFHGGHETDGNFSIEAQSGNDQIFTGAGDDYIQGGDGTNTLHSGDGNDNIQSDGVDTIDGGNGYDFATINRGSSTANLIFHMNSIGAVTHLQGDGTTVTNVEAINLIGGSGNDTFFMSDGNDSLNGGIGNDTLSGGGGSDSLSGGIGSNTLNGGGGDDYINSAGTDTVDGGSGHDILFADLSSATGNLNFNMSDPSHVTTIHGDGTTVTGVEEFTIDAGSGNDHLATGDGDDGLYGGGGDDELIGRGGDDYLSDSSGNNAMYGGGGDDSLQSFGTGTVDGGAGNDFAYIGLSAATANLTFHMTDPSQVTAVVGGGVTVTNVENITIDGGSGNDHFTTGDGADSLQGNAGNDTLKGGKGDDTLNGGPGHDILNGGAGIDTAHFGDAPGGVHASLVTGKATGDGSDTLIGIENLEGSTYDDVLTGNSGDNFFDGNNGADKMNGGGGNDSVVIFRFGASVNLTFHMHNPAHATTLVGDGTSVRNIENIELAGGDGDDTFITGAGNDILEGDAGHNTLSGGGGDDSLISRGVDHLDGGSGIDEVTLDVFSTYNDLVFNETSSTHTTTLKGWGTTVKNAENINIYGGFGNDHFTTVDGDDVLSGYEGNDVLSSGDGNDVLEGGRGADILNGGSGKDRYSCNYASESSGRAGHDTVIGFDANNDKFDFVSEVTGINGAVTSGLLRDANFDADLAAGLHGHLDPHHAVVFTPNHGTLAGKTFLVVDTNGVAGYQAGADFVFELKNAAHLASLDKGNFVQHELMN